MNPNPKPKLKPKHKTNPRRTRWAATRGASYDLQRFVVESTAAVVQGAVVAAAAAAERAEL